MTKDVTSMFFVKSWSEPPLFLRPLFDASPLPPILEKTFRRIWMNHPSRKFVSPKLTFIRLPVLTKQHLLGSLLAYKWLFSCLGLDDVYLPGLMRSCLLVC